MATRVAVGHRTKQRSGLAIKTTGMSSSRGISSRLMPGVRFMNDDGVRGAVTQSLRMLRRHYHDHARYPRQEKQTVQNQQKFS